MTSMAFELLLRRNPEARERAETMSGGQFQSLRQLMQMTQAEAGTYLADRPVSERAVQYWEAGKRAIPLDAARSLWALVMERDTQLDKIWAQIKADPSGAVVLWYGSQEDWAWRQQNIRFWKLHNSVAAAVYAAKLAELVTFDAAAFEAWVTNNPRRGLVSPDEAHLAWAKAVAWTEKQAPTDRDGN